MTVSIRPVEDRDKKSWNSLYEGYSIFYKVTQTQDMRDQVWLWLHDSMHETCGFVAEDEHGEVIGLAHYRQFARPLAAATGGFLDDLFVDPAARGSGAADALIQALKDEGVRKGWTVIRWITAEDNYRARGVYDKLAAQTKWVTYDIKL